MCKRKGLKFDSLTADGKKVNIDSAICSISVSSWECKINEKVSRQKNVSKTKDITASYQLN